LGIHDFVDELLVCLAWIIIGLLMANYSCIRPDNLVHTCKLEFSLTPNTCSMKCSKEFSSGFLEGRLMLRSEINLLVWTREQSEFGHENSRALARFGFANLVVYLD